MYLLLSLGLNVLLLWNCRGSGHKSFKPEMHLLPRKNQPDAVFFCETKYDNIGGHKFPTIFHPRYSYTIVPSIGLAGGLPYASSFIWGRLSHFNCPSSFLLCATYGAPKRYLINRLKDLLSLYNEPCLIIGGLNILFEQHEKAGGKWNQTFQHNVSVAWSKLDAVDLGFIGNCFTWTNKQWGQSRILARLVRACVDDSWLSLFPNAKLYHLKPVLSVHIHILLEFDPKVARGDKMFRFETSGHLRLTTSLLFINLGKDLLLDLL